MESGNSLAKARLTRKKMMNTTYGRLLALVVLGSLGFCSCRGVPKRETSSESPRPESKATIGQNSPIVSRANPTGNPIVLAQHTSPALPFSAYTGDPGQDYHGGMSGHCPHCSPGSSGPFHFSSHAEELQWAPDGIALPWPHDEYICDGGDINEDANIKKDESVVGVDQEDTIAHYKTLDGRKEIIASVFRICVDSGVPSREEIEFCTGCEFGCRLPIFRGILGVAEFLTSLRPQIEGLELGAAVG